MPRIDPLSLLKCLSILLGPNGGIKSSDEVSRIANLMTKFSKKLVSKCIYIQILKNTDADLLNQFMAAGGWDLIHLWLTDAVGVKNWALIEELLSLLLLCPVDIERLKSNNCPKFIKGLSKEDSHQDIKLLATRLVEQWLKIVKGEAPPNSVPAQIVTETSSPTVAPKCDDPEPSTAPPLTPATPISCTTVSSTCEVEAEAPKPTVTVPSSSTQSSVYKITIRDGKQVLTKIESEVKPEVVETNGETIKAEVVESMKIESENSENLKEVKEAVVEEKVEEKVKKDEKVNDKENKKEEKKKSSHHSSSKSSSKHSSSHRSSSSSSSHRSSKSSSSSSSRHKTSEKDHHHGSSSKSGVKKDKEKLKKDQAEKDKATLEKVQGHSLSKSIGKIPKKKSEDEKKEGVKEGLKENKDEKAKKLAQIAEKKNISISIENRRNSQDATSRPKTVKTFNSKFRSTGLEEEVKPPPSRNQVNKKPASNSVLPDKKPVIPSKLPAPTRDTSAAPSAEKKIKLSLDPTGVEEKKGSIKLIKPKPMLQESDMFMDALTASTKAKEPRKRKRKTSSSSIKDGPTDAKKQETTFDPVKEVNSPPSSPIANSQSDDKSPVVVKPEFKFYQDTLETEEDKEDKMKLRSSNKKVKLDDDDELKDNAEDNGGSTTPTDDADETNSFEGVDIDVQVAEAIEKDSESALPIKSDVLKSVLVLQKKKGPKKSLKWKTDLESIRYFELDETERVNVTKTFTDMKQMEKQNEREAFQMARKLCNEDLMEEKTQWRALVPIDLPPPLVKPGKDSREKDIQYAREKGILQALYLNRSMIPDSAAEPDDERHTTTDPKVIPLDDLTGNKESEKDFTSVPWPEPKGMSQTALGHKPPVTPMNAFPFHPGMYPGNHQAPMIPNQMMVTTPIMGMDTTQAAPTVAPVPPPSGGGWRTGDGKMVMDVHNSMPGFPPQGMDPMMAPPPGMMAPHMFNPQQPEKYDEMPYFQGMPPPPHGVPGPPAMYGPPPNFQGPRMPPPANRGRGGPPGGWFPRGGMPPPGPRGAAWRGPWRGSSKQPPLCRQFSKNGYCRVGDKCQFLHPPGFAPY